MHEGKIYDFLDKMDNQELLGCNEPFVHWGFTMESVTKQVHGYRMQTRSTIEDAKRMQPHLGYRHLNVIRHTLANTMQLASQFLWIPLQRHVESMFPFLNKTRLHETVATDNMFTSSKDLSGAWCAQIFYGLSSRVINVYGMKSETEGPDALDDFGRYKGIATIIRSDNSKMQRYDK
jgi:hypothetical protein